MMNLQARALIRRTNRSHSFSADAANPKKQIGKGSASVSGSWKLWMREHRLFFAFSLLLFFGVAFGAVAAGYAQGILLKKIDFLFYASFLTRTGDSYGQVFMGSFASSFVFILAFLLCGLSVWGMFLVPFLVFFRGFGMGLISGYLYVFYGWQGCFYNFLVVLPGAFLCSLAFLFAAQESSKLSRTIRIQKRPDYRIFFVRFGVVLCMLFFAALCDLAANFCFADFFSFSVQGA